MESPNSVACATGNESVVSSLIYFLTELASNDNSLQKKHLDAHRLHPDFRLEDHSLPNEAGLQACSGTTHELMDVYNIHSVREIGCHDHRVFIVRSTE